jgi:vitamin B12 transporter
MADFDDAGASENDRFSWQAKYFIGKDTQNGLTVNASYWNDIQGAQGRITGNFDEIDSSLTLGFDWTEYDFETASSNLHQYKYTDLGGYLMAQTRFLEDRLVFSGGARLNHISNETGESGGHKFSESKITPALGVSYLANDWLKLRANYAKGYRAPSPNEMFGEGPTMIGRNSVVTNYMGGATWSNVWLVPNLDLKPQSSDSIEAGVDVEYNGFTGSLTAFYSRFQDKIERVDTPWDTPFALGMYGIPTGMGMNMMYGSGPGGLDLIGKNVFFSPGGTGARMPPYVATAQYVNFGNADMAGLEWALKWNLGETYGWNFALAPYSRGTWLPLAKYKGGPEDGLSMRKVPKWYTSYGLEFQTPDNDVWIDLNFLSRDQQRTAVMTSDPKISDTQPGWTVVSLRLSKTLYDMSDYGKISLQGEVANIFDEYYEVNPTYPLPGRSFYAGLRFDFN